MKIPNKYSCQSYGKQISLKTFQRAFFSHILYLCSVYSCLDLRMDIKKPMDRLYSNHVWNMQWADTQTFCLAKLASCWKYCERFVLIQQYGIDKKNFNRILFVIDKEFTKVRWLIELNSNNVAKSVEIFNLF